jgi:hypothetical protein
MFEFYQLIPFIAFITGKDYCQTGTLEVLISLITGCYVQDKGFGDTSTLEEVFY